VIGEIRVRDHILKCRLYAAALVLTACSHAAPDSTPEGAVQRWIERMEASSEDPRAMKEAYALLGPAARANLEERATRTSRLQGRRVEAYEMIADGRFGLRFRPKNMKATVTSDHATVQVLGNDPALDHATVQCVHEPAGWRIEPELPELPAAPRR
jgi:hypothetical protein